MKPTRKSSCFDVPTCLMHTLPSSLLTRGSTFCSPRPKKKPVLTPDINLGCRNGLGKEDSISGQMLASLPTRQTELAHEGPLLRDFLFQVGQWSTNLRIAWTTRVGLASKLGNVSDDIVKGIRAEVTDAVSVFRREANCVHFRFGRDIFWGKSTCAVYPQIAMKGSFSRISHFEGRLRVRVQEMDSLHDWRKVPDSSGWCGNERMNKHCNMFSET